MNERHERFWDVPGTSWETPGDPGGLQKLTENRCLAKKGLSNRDFCRFLCTKPVYTIFARLSIDCSREIDEKSMEKLGYNIVL